MKRKILFLSAVLVFFSLSTDFLWAKTLFLKNGRTIDGDIIEASDSAVVLDFQGVKLTFYKDEIANPLDFFASDTRPEKPKTYYRVTRIFTFRALGDLRSLHFRFPLIRNDIPHQKVTNIQIIPKENARPKDPQGNETPVFYFSDIKSGEQKTVKIIYDVEIEPITITVMPEALMEAYRHPIPELTSYWLSEEKEDYSTNDSIRAHAQKIIQGIDNPFLKARAIYDYMAQMMQYETRDGIRPTPLETLVNKRGKCTDFAVLFHTLSRSAGIPSRLVFGLVFEPKISPTKSEVDSWHMWNEIYVPGYGWTPIDPTFALSDKKQWFCFPYQVHIREGYGQINSSEPGSLFRGTASSCRPRQKMHGKAFTRNVKVTIERLEK